MVARCVAACIALLDGGWMVFDGFHAIYAGRYFGPSEPGPWSDLVSRAGIDPYALGPLFVAMGLLWITGAGAVLSQRKWGWWLTVALAIGSLWYLVIGTVVASVYLVVAVLFRDSLK